MNWQDWYTDTMSIYRVREVLDGNLTRHERALVSGNIPCRIYQSDNRPINMAETAALNPGLFRVYGRDGQYRPLGEGGLRFPNQLVEEGWVHPSSVLRFRAFAGEPNLYYEPFGAIIPGLAHQEIRLLQQERVT